MVMNPPAWEFIYPFYGIPYKRWDDHSPDNDNLDPEKTMAVFFVGELSRTLSRRSDEQKNDLPSLKTNSEFAP